MIARFAELWLVEDWGDYEFDHAAEQVTKLWANAIGLPPTAAGRSAGRSEEDRSQARRATGLEARFRAA